MELLYKHADQVHTLHVDRKGEAFEVRIGERTLTVTGRHVGHSLFLEIDGKLVPYQFSRLKDDRYLGDARRQIHLVKTDASHLRGDTTEDAAKTGEVMAPMPGKIIRVMVVEDQRVEKDEDLLVMEAMKMEYTIRAPRAGRVEKIKAVLGAQLDLGTDLMHIAEESEK